MAVLQEPVNTLTAASRFIAGVTDPQSPLHKLAEEVLTEHLRPAELSAAVFRLAQQALAALPFTKISHAEVACAACAAVAGLTEHPCFPAETGKSHLLRVLEELARHVAIFQAFAYSFLSRTGFGHLEGLDEATRRMQGLLVGVGVWLLAAFGRAINYSCLGPSTLWEWANGDALYACMMVRNTLILPKLLGRPPWSSYKLFVDVGGGGVPLIPNELSVLQNSMVTSLLGLAGTMVAFHSFEGMEVPNPSLLLLQHRARLAVALSETTLVPLLFDCVEGGQASAVELVSFLGKVLNTELWQSEELCDAPDLVDASRMALALFRDTLADHEGRLWSILAAIPPKTRLLRSFLRDCSGLAMVLPSECWVELLDSANIAHELKDWAALAGLCCIASNASMGPAEAPNLAHIFMNLLPQEREAVLQQLERWPTMGDAQVWQNLLQEPSAMVASPRLRRPKPPSSLLETKHRKLLASGMEALLIDAPLELCCSLDGRLLTSPVRSPSGDVFDAASLASYLTQTDGTSPSGQVLTLDMCHVDTELQRACLQHIKRWARGMPL